MLDQLSKNITRCGLSNSTLNYLRVSMQGVGRGEAPLDLGQTQVVCLVLSAARCLAVLGHGEAGERAKGVLQMGCEEPWSSVPAGACPAWLVGQMSSEELLLGPGASRSNPACLCSLQLCVILEPMQELMSRHKTYSLSPRDCLKTCLFQKWQRMVAPPGEPHAACSAAHRSPGLPAQACPQHRLLPAAPETVHGLVL